MRDSPELHWSTQAGTSSSVRDPYPARGLILHRRPLSGLPPHSRGERRIKRWGIAAGTATGAALGTKSNAKAERKCQNFALVTTLFSGSASSRRVGRGSSQYLLPSSPVATHFPAVTALMSATVAAVSSSSSAQETASSIVATASSHALLSILCFLPRLMLSPPFSRR